MDPQFENTAVFIGNFDRYLNRLDTVQPKYFEGANNHSVAISVALEREGLNKLKGIIRDFDIRRVNDTLGVTVAFDTYFEYPYG